MLNIMHTMTKRKNKILGTLLLGLCLTMPATQAAAQRRFMHPGITYTQADIDRMKAMIATRQEPYYSTFQALQSSSYSSPGSGSYSDVTQIKESGFNSSIGADGRRAHDMALLYHLTGEEKYAKDAVARLNRYNNLTNASSRGTAALDNGKIYLLLEAAELLRDYSGWDADDQAAFKKMLTYPFYSTIQSAESYKSTTDSLNNVTFYWNIYNMDRGRFGNQGLFGGRGLMAMGIYLDNDTIYDRAYRYLLCLPEREDDVPSQHQYPAQGSESSRSTFKIDYNYGGWIDQEDQFFSDECLKYYIYQNGQTQESCRDQGHTLGGLGTYSAIAEIAWNQGDSLYSCLDNRILLGMEYNLRYNLSRGEGYSPWDPVKYSENEKNCTYDNGYFYRALSRSKRWKALRQSTESLKEELGEGGWRTQVLMHYNVRAGIPVTDMPWLKLSYDQLMDTYGLENWGTSPNWYYEWCGWGTLTKYRSAWMAGDPGTWEDGQRKSGLPATPCDVLAADFDYYAMDGEGLTFHNVGTTASSVYRTDAPVELALDTDAQPYVTSMEDGEWISYTLNFADPQNRQVAGVRENYDIYVTYRASQGGDRLTVCVDDGTTESVELAQADDWTKVKVGTVEVLCGAAVLRVGILGMGNRIELKTISVENNTDETTVTASTDVTDVFLTNPDFESTDTDQNFIPATGIVTYAKDVDTYSADASGLQKVEGWTPITRGEDGASGGVYAYGSKTFLGGTGFKVPSSAGNSGELQALGVVGCWGIKAQYTQTVTLPAGTYTLSARIYNAGGTSTPTQNLLGFIESDGTAHTATAHSYSSLSWVTDSVTFTLSEQTTGRISVGYQPQNVGSTTCPHLFVENVKLCMSATTDTVTTKYVQNAAFEATDAAYTSVAAQGQTVESGAQAVEGWTAVGDDSAIASVVAYGSGASLGSTAYATPSQGEDDELQALGMLATQDATVQYVQQVTLPAGSYTLAFPLYNAGSTAVTPAQSLFGFIEDDGTAHMTAARSYQPGAWTTDSLILNLDQETTGTISVGFQSADATVCLLAEAVRLAQQSSLRKVLVLSDYDTDTPGSGNFDAVVYQRTLTEGWNTIVLPFDVTIDELGAQRALDYHGTREDSTVTSGYRALFKDAGDTLQANVPYLIWMDNEVDGLRFADKYSHPTDSIEVADYAYGVYSFKGTYAYSNPSKVQAEDYLFSSSDIETTDGRQELKAYRAYMCYTDTLSASLTLWEGDDQTDGVATVQLQSDDDGNYYTLSGLRVARPTRPGVYIKGRKKVLKSK